MSTIGKLSIVLAALSLVSLASCHHEQRGETTASGPKGRTGVTEVGPIEADRMVAGQTIYVPAYPSILTSDRANAFDLAVTLSLRNTDPERSIVVASARYYDRDGKMIRDYLKKPLRLGPMASTEFFVAEHHSTGEVSASFLVEWVAESRVNAPLVESVMVGTAGTQGVSFTSRGRVLTDRAGHKSGADAEGPWPP
jgi:hypothetical protein